MAHMASTSGLLATTSTQIDNLFAAENNKGILFFSGGRTAVQTGALSPDEINAILRSYRSNLLRIQHVSQSLYNDLVAQQSPNLSQTWQTDGNSVLLKMAQIAKGTLASQGGTKTITWPPQVGQIGVAWIDPFLLQYSRAHNSTYPAYTSYTPNSWNITYPTPGNGLVQMLGTATYTQGTPPATVSTLSSQNYYQANATLNQRQLWFIFQNGILEIGSTPDIQEWIIQTSLTQAYNTYTTDPQVYQPIEERKLIYQYNTPESSPCTTIWGYTSRVWHRPPTHNTPYRCWACASTRPTC